MTETVSNSSLDEIINDYLQLQIICMVLQHEGCNKIREGDSENGLSMLESVRNMRKSLGEVYDSIGEEAFESACSRIDFDRKLFFALSDAVLRDNTLYFNFWPRPEGIEYACDEIACKAKIFALSREYFPSMYQKVA